MAEARLNREYALRLLGVGVMMTGMCVWALYDGVRGWPAKNRALEAARPALVGTNLTAEAWLGREDEEGPTRLAAVFVERGQEVPSKLVKKIGELKLPDRLANDPEAREGQARRLRQVLEGPVYSEHDLRGQFVMAALTLFFGALAFGAVARKAGRRFVADARGLSGSGFGGGVRGMDELERIDWKRWDDKGIATLYFKAGGRVVLDAWHYVGVAGVLEEIRRQRPDLPAPQA